MRVFERNDNRGDTYSLEVTAEIFSHTEKFFGPPIGIELVEAIIVET